MTPEHADAVRERLDKAIDLVCALASGDKQWRMSIPASEEKDSDLLLVNVLGEAKALLNEIRHLSAENEALRRGQGHYEGKQT